MKKQSRVKTALLISSVFVLLVALSAWCGLFAFHGAAEDVLTSSYADEPVSYEALPLDLTTWTPNTYLNAPEFDFDATVTLTGTDYDCIGYSLLTTSDEQYSMEASLFSPKLNVAINTYSFRFSYFTRMRASTPHRLTLLASDDGSYYEEVDAMDCSSTGEEFFTGTLTVSGAFSYLKLELYTFYSYDDESDLTDRGLYFISDGFSLVTEEEETLDQSYFSINLSTTEPFLYSGSVQQPEVVIFSNLYSESYDYTYVTTTYLEGQSDACSPVHPGHYVMAISVRDRANTVCFTVEKPFEIAKETLTVRNIDYICNASYIAILNVDVVDSTDRAIPMEELDLTYFTSTRDGQSRVESASPVLHKPAQEYSAGIMIGNDVDFDVTAGDETVFSVEDTLGSEPYYFIEKNSVLTYDGQTYNPLQSVFFSEPGVNAVPNSAPEASYYFVGSEGEEKVSSIKKAGQYRCVIAYGEQNQRKGSNEYEFFVTVQPRPVVTYLYTGNSLVKSYDGTDVLFDQELGASLTSFKTTDLVCIDDPDFAGEDGILQNELISDEVQLQYEKAVYARSVGKTYVELLNPVLIGSDASNYYLHSSFHILSAVLLKENTFEIAGGVYYVSSDDYYHSPKEYVTGQFAEQPIAVGDPIPSETTYYEYDASGSRYYPTTDDFFADGKKYYRIRSEKKVENNVVAVTPSYLVLKSDKDATGITVSCPNKVYSPGDYSAPSVDSDVVIPCYGNNAEPITYKKISFFFSDCNVGTHELSLYLSDMTLHDRYLPDILTPVALQGTILPRPLTVDTTMISVSGLSKVYDGTDTAYPVFNDFTLTETPADFPAFSDYTVSFRTATYAQANVSDSNLISVSGVSLVGLTASARAFLSNYSIENFQLQGEIRKKELEVYTESIRIFERQSPSVRSNAEAEADLRKRIYPDKESARAGGTAIPFSSTSEGEYVLRVDVVTNNYFIPAPGYVLIPMEVIATQKARQKILVSNLDLSSGNDFTILARSVLTLDVHSVDEESHLDTGLSVTCTLSVLPDSDGCLIVIGNSTWRTSKTGRFTLTLTQPGNNYYYEADPLVLNFSISNASSLNIDGTSGLSGLYAGDDLPTLSADRYTATYNGTEIAGNLVSNGSQTLTAGEAVDYPYYFEADPVISSFRADYTIPSGTSYYVKSGSSYEKYAGSYNPYESYFSPEYQKIVTVAGNIIPTATYYENAYVVTSDSVFSADKTYYLAHYEKEDFFFPTEDAVFMQGKTYYTVSYRVAYVPTDAAIEEEYYELVGADYVLTSDTVFDGEKTYYAAYYVQESTVPGRTIPSATTYYEKFLMPRNIYYEKEKGQYFITEDVVFLADKTYYTVSYRAAAIQVGATIGRTLDYYEYDSSSNSYFKTNDNVFDGEKIYYTALYTEQTVVEGNEIPVGATYYERTEDVYTLTTDVEFNIEKTYYRIVYSQAVVDVNTSITETYYEIDPDDFMLTYDNRFSADKDYYTLSYLPVHFISVGDIIDTELYREKTEDSTLAITPGDTFAGGKNYVLATWTPASGEPADAYYEKNPIAYTQTEDQYFLTGKTYYILQFSPISFTAGDAVSEDVYEYLHGEYVRTTDEFYLSGKKYYLSSYIVALSPEGQPLSGKTYYEKEPDSFFLTSDDPLDAGKTYYVLSYVDVKFLLGSDLPIGEFYHSVPSYEQTVDTAFRRDVVYYTVSYEAAEVTVGDHVVGEYYERKGSAYTLTSDLYFSNAKTYYLATFTAQDTLKNRSIDEDNAYYLPAQGTYADDKEYYRFVGGAFTAVEVEVGTPVQESTYVLVTDPEFEQNTRYYFASYLFVGQAPVDVALSASKTTITVYTVAASSSLYGEEPDPFDFIEKITVTGGEEKLVPFREWEDLNLVFSLQKASAENEISDFSFSSQVTGEYLFENNQRPSYSQETIFLSLLTEEDDSHTFVLSAGTTTHTIEKNVITVQLPEQEKFYGESIPSERTLTQNLSFAGSTEEIENALRQNYTFSTQAYSYSDCGEYPIYILKKDMLTAGSAIPENTYYERTEGAYVITGDTAFTEGKSYYEYIEDSYVLTEDVLFDEEKTYYEKQPDSYLLTEDTVFSKEKSYYVVVYNAATVTFDEEIGSGYYIYNDGEYTAASGTFAEGTVYYTLEYVEATIYRGITVEELEQNYDIIITHGYLLVDPISLLIGASSEGHNYGNNRAEITIDITVLSRANLSQEEKNKLSDEVIGDVVAFCEDLTSQSDSGNYPITIVYNGLNPNVIVTTRKDCYYPVHSAKLSTQSFQFVDTSVLYDGMLHTITVSYNTALWPDVSISYDKGSFSEIGDYLYTAVVSLKNYEDLTLTATMSICTLTVNSSNRVNNAVTVVITDPTCINGVNGRYNIVLRSVADEDKVAELTAIIDGLEPGTHTVKGVYSIITTLDSSETSLGYSSYTVTVAPNGLKYQNNLALYGYSRGQFQKLNYTYNNGAYTFTVSSPVDDTDVDPLSYFAFVEVVETRDEGVQYKWIFVAIIAVVVLFLLGVVVMAMSSSGKKRGRSRHRHNRLV